MVDQKSGKGARAEEGIDQLERSKKKLKMISGDNNGASVQVVMETQFGLAIDADISHGGCGVKASNPERVSFRDVLRDKDDRAEPSASYFGGCYDEGYVSDDDEVASGEEDPLCPMVHLTKAEKVRLRNPWRKTLIIKVMGKPVGFNFLYRRIRMLWHPSRDMELVTMDNDYFFVKFEMMGDYNFAKFEGLWVILEHNFIIKEWVPNFDPFMDYLKNVLVWVRFPCLSIEYYNSDFLMKLGGKIGRPIKVDYTISVT